MNSLRMCVSCREMRPKNELFRFVKLGDSISLDKTYKMDGRGCYTCKNDVCINKAIKGGLINKSLKTSISKERLLNLLNE